MATSSSKALQNFRKHLQRMLNALNEIEHSDIFINVLSRKISKKLLEEKQMLKPLENVIEKYPSKYVQNLFVINTISLMEVYLKDRIIEEFTNNKSAVIQFLQNYESYKKITVEDVINGPLNLAVNVINDIAFHNLPKVERMYSYAFEIDIKKMADFKLLNLSVKIRHAFVHELGKIKGKEFNLNNNHLQEIINEVAVFIENIDFYLINKRKKTKHPNYYIKSEKKYNSFVMDDQLYYAQKKLGGI